MKNGRGDPFLKALSVFAIICIASAVDAECDGMLVKLLAVGNLKAA